LYDKAPFTWSWRYGFNLNKAFVIRVHLKNYDEALALTEEILERYPKHRGLLCLTAEIYKETGIEGLASYYEDRLLRKWVLKKQYFFR
jgi:hypothetical protein